MDIKETHDYLLKHPDYLDEVYKKAIKVQERLNCFVSIVPSKLNINEDILSGVPYVLKDNISTKDIKTTASSKMLEDYIPPFSATVVLKLQNSTLIGKTSMDELGMGGTNKNALTGPVRNPWNVKRISGGSSGGSVVAVVSGLVPFSIGTDTGDSIRKPAGYCGVVGFKPTYGRVSRYGVIPYASSLDHVGIITRNVKDSAIVFERIAGHDEMDATSSHKEVKKYSQLLKLHKPIKIAHISNITNQCKKEIQENVYRVIELLSEKCIIEDIIFPQELLDVLYITYMVISNSESTSNHACLDGIKYGYYEEKETIIDTIKTNRTKGFSLPVKTRFMLGNYSLHEENQEKIVKKAQKIRRFIVNEMNRIFNNYDIILTPNSNSIAPLLTDEDIDTSFLENHLVLANFAGIPSITIPSGFYKDMPIGINLNARQFDEETLFQVAHYLESLLPYKNQYKEDD